MIDILLVLIFTSISCSILGIFLILRKLSMLTDAISHSVLLGIVIAYYFTKDLSSPLLIVGATIIGFLTVILIEALGNSKLAKYDDAIGVVFPIIFSIAVIIISTLFRNVHLDTDVVLLGEVLFASLDRINLLGYSIPRQAIIGLANLTLIILFVYRYYNKLKISTFNEEYAKLIGIKTGMLFYALMILTSLTAVVSFNSVGAILVVSFFIAPAASALLFAKNLKNTILLTTIISIFNCIVSILIAFSLNVSISGMAASLNMLVFILLLIFKKIRGRNVN